MMIDSTLPDDWRGLQKAVAQIMDECGLSVETEKTIDTVRGTVNIDVFAIDQSQTPPITYLCECKHWKSSVPKTVVHSFRTIVGDYGANWGLIVSSAGFQAGAYEAARNTNVLLLNWQEFQELFVDRWVQHYMASQVEKEADPLIEYTEPINSRIFRKADLLTDEARNRFRTLREEYGALGFLALAISMRGFWDYLGRDRSPKLPLKDMLQGQRGKGLPADLLEGLPADLLEATALRDFLNILLSHARKGIRAFRELFGDDGDE